MTYGKHLNAATTPPQSPLPGRAAEMVKNPDGAYVFKIGDWERASRFLILGAVGGTYYAKESTLTVENAECLINCIKTDGVRLVGEILRVSSQGIAPKNDPAIFGLALASHFGDEKTKRAAYVALPEVCRTGTHLFTFCEYRQAVGGGWGSGIRRAIGKWYRERKPADLIFQALKYRQRNGWDHASVLRLAHPKTSNEAYKAIYDAICAPKGGPRTAPKKNKTDELVVRGEGRGWEALRNYPVVDGYLKLSEAEDLKPADAAKIIADCKLPFEMIPTELLTQPVVWEAMLPHLGLTAVIRNLGNMSKCGFLAPLSGAAKDVVGRVTDIDNIKKSRVHPWHVILATATYGQGKGFRGKGEWTVVPQVRDALEFTFENAFRNVKPTGKRFLLATDVSPSMSMQIDGSPLSAATAAAAMMLITLRTEPEYYAFGFASQFVDLKISKTDSLPSVIEKAHHYSRNFGGTDCSVPIRWALQNKTSKVDAVMVYTDNETNSGPAHAAALTEKYRREVGPIKVGMVAFTATDRSVADPKDPHSMNFVGMDASLPAAISAFVSE